MCLQGGRQRGCSLWVTVKRATWNWGAAGVATQVWGDAAPNVPGELGQLGDARSVSAGVLCVFRLCSAQLGLCFHPMFHEEQMAHKQMWNSHYAYAVPYYINPTGTHLWFRNRATMELTVFPRLLNFFPLDVLQKERLLFLKNVFIQNQIHQLES